MGYDDFTRGFYVPKLFKAELVNSLLCSLLVNCPKRVTVNFVPGHAPMFGLYPLGKIQNHKKMRDSFPLSGTFLLSHCK